MSLVREGTLLKRYGNLCQKDKSTDWLSLDYSGLPYFPVSLFEGWTKRREDGCFILTGFHNSGYGKIIIDDSLSNHEPYLVMSILEIEKRKYVETHQADPDKLNRVLKGIKKGMEKKIKGALETSTDQQL